MKVLFTVLIAVVLASCATTQEVPVVPEPVVSTDPVEVEITSPIVVTVDEPVKDTTARIDAVEFLKILVDSGCTVDKAEYKEVDRGGGISITCAAKAPDAPSSDPLSSEGLEGL